MSPGTLCHEFFAPTAQSRKGRRALDAELTQLAGGQDKVFWYCFPYLRSWAKTQRPNPVPSFGGYPGGPGGPGGPGYPGAGDSGAGYPGAGYPGAGDSGAGDSGAGDPVPSTAGAGAGAGVGAGGGPGGGPGAGG